MEVKYLLILVFAGAFILLISDSGFANHFSICAPGCNSTVVWWNDTLNVTGSRGGSDAVTVSIDGSTRCSIPSGSAGTWSCVMQAPMEVGSYNLSVSVGSITDESTLLVRPTFGREATGAISRLVIETPFAVQEPSGSINSLLTRLTVSRGLPQ